MQIIVSMETATDKIKLGVFEDPLYASLFIRVVANENLLNKNYIKLITEVSEKEDKNGFVSIHPGKIGDR